VIRLLVTQYYRSDSRLAAGRPMAVVERVIDRLLARRIPVLVCFTPANFEYLGDRINAPMYEFNVSEFRELLRRRYQSDARFRLAVFEGSIPARLFLDHSHLSADGNELMAQMMVREFQILWSAKDGKS
jgi:lysophospholipase L1-like esterase